MDHFSNNCEFYPSFKGLELIRSILNTVENEANNKEKDSLHWLNDDCLRIILGFLDKKSLHSVNVKLVCKRWFILINSLIFCKSKLNLHIAVDAVDDKNYKESDMIHIGETLFNFILALYFSWGRVSELILSTAHGSQPLTDVQPRFLAIIHFCPNLSKFSICNCAPFLKMKLEKAPFSFPSHLCEFSLTQNWIKEHTLNNILKLSSTTLQKLRLSSAGLFSGLSIIEHLKDSKMKVFEFTRCPRLSPSILPFIFKTYHATLEEFIFPSSLMTLPNLYNEILVMEKLKSVTIYEVINQEGKIGRHDDDIVMCLFKLMVKIENLSILTDSCPLYRKLQPCQFFDYMTKIMLLKNLKNLTLPLEPMKNKIFGDNLLLNKLNSVSGVKIRINSDF